MRFVFPFLGKTREKFLNDGINEYVKRLKRFVDVEIAIIRENSSRKVEKNIALQKEAENLLSVCKAPSFIIALDPKGTEYDSLSLSSAITDWQDRGVRTVNFLIGGHFGLHESVLDRADLVISLSRLTFTHEMTRMILLEQLYRGWMIKSGRSYHY